MILEIFGWLCAYVLVLLFWLAIGLMVAMAFGQMAEVGEERADEPAPDRSENADVLKGGGS